MPETTLNDEPPPPRKGAKAKEGTLLFGARALASFAGAVTAIPVLTVAGWWLLAPHVTPWLRTALGVDSVAAAMVEVKAKQEEQGALLASVAKTVRHLNGDDQILSIDYGASFVEEPVHSGQPVNLRLMAERTTLGVSCRVTGFTPIFIDRSGVLIPGERAEPGRPYTQIGDEKMMLSIGLRAPAALLPGKIRLRLSIYYLCPVSAAHGGERSTKRITQQTQDFSYRLLAE